MLATLTSRGLFCSCTGSVCANTTQWAATVNTALHCTMTGPGRQQTAGRGLLTSAEVSINLHSSKAFFVEDTYLWIPSYLLKHNIKWWVTEATHKHTHITAQHDSKHWKQLVCGAANRTEWPTMGCLFAWTLVGPKCCPWELDMIQTWVDTSN